MPTISVFAFERQSQQLAGPFRQIHMTIGDQSQALTWEAMWGIPQIHAIVAYARPDTEICQSLGTVVNDQSVLDFVDSQFASTPPDPHVLPPVRRGPIRASYMTWGDALATPQTTVTDRNAHESWELINTVSIDFHCNTDIWLSALNGTITIYVFYFLDADGHPQVRIEGFSDPVWDEQPWRPDWGAAGQVSARLATTLAEDRPVVQVLLENALQQFAGSQIYAELYILPGTGATIGPPFYDNADNNVALCLIPA